jgi:hypothetical protein
MNQAHPNDERRDVRLSFYLVAYIDLLGQSDELLKIARIPQNEEEKKATITAIKNSAGRVRAVRSAFDNFVGKAKTISAEALKAVPEIHHASFKRLRSIQVQHRGFSDSMIVTVPLHPGTDPEGISRAIAGVWTALFGIAGISLTAFSLGVPLRAGIEVDLGLDVFRDEVYGPALVNAYDLESKVASYPRAVLGPKLLNYLAEVKEMSPDIPFSRYAIHEATQCEALICSDPDDEKPMLHILSPMMTQVTPQLAEYRADAEAWVQREARRFRNEGNVKLADRYVRLAKYFATYPLALLC